MLRVVMQYDFDHAPDRRGTASLKWERYRDRDILPLWVADMDFVSAPEIIDALRQRLEHGVYGYTIPPVGTIEAVQLYLNREYSWKVPEEQILWVPGLVPALNIACRAYGKQGDEVVAFSPVYPPFISAPGYADRQLINIPLVLQGGRWTMDLDRLEQEITPRTRLLLLCSPHNPVGTVFTREELVRLGEICVRNDLVICSDEIHCDLVLDDGVKHIPIATVSAELAERTLTLMAPSKTYNLPGLACAFVVIPNARLRQTFQLAARGIITEVTLFGYTACEAAYRHGEPWRKQLIAYLRRNRDTVYSFFAEKFPEIKLHPMQATYLAWLDVSALGLQDPAAFFEQHGVGLSSGRLFHGEGHVRLNFGCPYARLQEGLQRMEKALLSR
jgi:cystathionine beta-lyase